MTSLVDIAVSASGNTNRYDWIRAYCASKIVGRRDGQTAELAERCGVGVDAVERWAAAWRMHSLLPPTAKNLRRVLPRSHYSIMLRLSRRYELDPTTCANLLASCLFGHKISSVVELEEEVEAEFGNRPPVNPRWHAIRIVNLLRAFLTFDEIPGAIRERCAGLMEILREWLE
jgi:hypothetical protein